MQTTRAWAPSAIPTGDFLLHDFGRADKLHAVKSHVGGVPAHLLLADSSWPGIAVRRTASLRSPMSRKSDLSDLRIYYCATRASPSSDAIHVFDVTIKA